MGNFNRDRGGRGNDRRGGGFRRDQGRGFNRGGDRPTMHKVICDACHKDCEVPFKPSNDKPIYCNECFAKQGGGRGGDRDRRPRFENRGSSQPNQNSKEILDGIKSLNYKLDELIKVLSPKAEKKEEKPAKKTEKKKTVTKKTITKKKK